MTESILNTTKKILGISEDYKAFDLDIVTHINSVLGTLNDLGVGPVNGFMITGPDETWDELIESEMRLNRVKSYVYLRVRLLFDPPTSSFHLESLKEQVKEMEWRLTNVIEINIPNTTPTTAP